MPRRLTASLAVLALSGALVACGDDDAGSASAPTTATVADPGAGVPADASMVYVTTPASGVRVAPGFMVAGCSRTFESNVPWRLLDRAGDVIAEGFATGGGVDGPAPFTFTVGYTPPSEEQVGHLEVEAGDPSDGEGFPPPRDVVPVVLAP